MGSSQAKGRLSALLLVVLMIACAGATATVTLIGCEEEIDVTTDEGLKKALASKEKLSEAMGELKSRASDVEKLKNVGDELAKLYVDGSEYDNDIITYLVRIKDIAYKDAYIKAIKSSDPSTVRQAAGAIADLKIVEAVEALIAAYHSTHDNEIRRVVLEAGVQLKHPELTKLANDLLAEKGPDDVPIANLRFACRVLETQADPSTVSTLLKALFYVDQAGRNIHADCSAAILAIGQPAVPPLLEMLKLENETVNRYVKRHEDIMTSDSVVLKAVTLLGKLRSQEAKAIILEHLGNPNAIEPPAALAAKEPSDPAWGEWSALIGQVSQELIFALNDIGVSAEDEEAIKLLKDLFQWKEPHPTKYKQATAYSNMIEISVRVNAARVLAENKLLTDENMQVILTTLKDKDFGDIKRLRPAARASIVQDLVTYLAIASQPGWSETVWKFFSEMAANELADDPAIKEKWGFEFDFQPARNRIAAVETAFKLADECTDNVQCYLTVLDSKVPDDRWRKIKAVYELGRIGNHDQFQRILTEFASLDAFGYMFAADALVRLGNAADVAAIDQELAKLTETRSGQTMQMLEGYLLPMKATLRSKTN